MTRKQQIEAARLRLKRFGYKDMYEAVGDIAWAMDEIDATRAMLGRLLAVSGKDKMEAQDARSFLEN